MRTPEELNQLCDQIGSFIQYWGFKKVDGTIWAHIFLAPEPIAAKQIMERIKVSKAQVSLSMKTLLKYGVIEESHTGDYGTTYFKSAEDLGSVIQNVLKNRELVNLETILEATHDMEKRYATFNMEKWADLNKVLEVRSMTETARLFLKTFIIDGNVLSKMDFSQDDKENEVISESNGSHHVNGSNGTASSYER